MSKWFERIFGSLVAVVSLSVYVINTLFWAIPIFFFSVFKLIPIAPLRKGLTWLLDACAAGWVSVNTIIQSYSAR